MRASSLCQQCLFSTWEQDLAFSTIEFHMLFITLAFKVTQFSCMVERCTPTRVLIPANGNTFFGDYGECLINSMRQETTPVPNVSPQPHSVTSSPQSNQLRLRFWSMSFPKGSFLPQKGSPTAASIWTWQAGSRDSRWRPHPMSCWGKMDIVGFRRVCLSPSIFQNNVDGRLTEHLQPPSVPTCAAHRGWGSLPVVPFWGPCVGMLVFWSAILSTGVKILI